LLRENARPKRSVAANVNAPEENDERHGTCILRQT